MDIIINVGMKLLAGVIVMIIHELPKVFTAYMVTHPIHRKRSDNKINIISYIDPIGLIMFVALGVGWQKPVEYNSSKFREKDKGILAISLSGILANLLVMAILIPLLITFKNGYLINFVTWLIYFNFSLAIINLLPVPPLEMSKIIYATSHNAYFKLIQNERIIHTLFILLIVIGILPKFIQILFVTSIAQLL